MPIGTAMIAATNSLDESAVDGVIDAAAELLGQDALLAIWSTMSRAHRADALDDHLDEHPQQWHERNREAQRDQDLATGPLPGAPCWWRMKVGRRSPQASCPCRCRSPVAALIRSPSCRRWRGRSR